MKEVKCVIWDLDNTLWDGVLLESEVVTLKPYIAEVIKELDSRGIIHSIASKNNFDDAMGMINQFGLSDYFLYPEIHWSSKVESVRRIQQNLNIGMDTIVFIDDQPFERDEVADSIPEVEVIDATAYLEILNYSRFNPKFITTDSKRRRLMYLEDVSRNKAEHAYQGAKEEFLATLNMEFIISEAREEDLMRAEELTIRTNQLNATGKTYSYETLRSFMESDSHKLYVCELTDRYGSYGKIGLALVEITGEHWCIHMLLMSCRVLSRSAGSVLLTYIMNQAKQQGKKLLAHFKQTDRNKMMYITFRFSNFHEVSNDHAGNIVFENDLQQIQKYPPYIAIRTPELYVH